MIMHNILASRIFFNLRETSRGEQRNTLATPLTEFHASAQEFSGISSSFGSSSSSGGIDPTKTIHTERVIEISRNIRAIQS